MSMTADPLMTVGCPDDCSETVAVLANPLPLTARFPPPWQRVFGAVPPTVGGGTITRFTISTERQPPGAGLVTTTAYVPGAKVPCGTDSVRPVQT
jgi:hypothetical protein